MNKLPVEILYEDAQMVAINKPSGMLTIADRHNELLLYAKGILENYFGKIFVVHRLDKDTSGVIVFAKDEATHKYLSQLFETRQVEKKYLGLVVGVPLETVATINQPIAESTTRAGFMIINKRGKPSITDYQVVQSFRGYSLLSFQLHTGRTHQIRTHCKHIGHPIVCDELYGDGKPLLLSSLKKKYKLSMADEVEKPLVSRLALHAAQLRFTHSNGSPIAIEAPLPKDMQAAIKQLEKNK